MDRYKGLTERLESVVDERYSGMDGVKDFIQKDLDLVTELASIVKLDVEFDLKVREIERTKCNFKIIELEKELEIINNKKMELFKSTISSDPIEKLEDEIIVIRSINNSIRFMNMVESLINQGYKISSTSCNSFTYKTVIEGNNRIKSDINYVAILIKEEL